MINHEEGIDACGSMLDGRSEEEKRKMPTEHIKELLNVILKSNCFKFLEKHYHQITGTAMGTPMAPGWANAFMGQVERGLLRQYEEETGLRPAIWFRFLDDIFFFVPTLVYTNSSLIHSSEELLSSRFRKISLWFLI